MQGMQNRRPGPRNFHLDHHRASIPGPTSPQPTTTQPGARLPVEHELSEQLGVSRGSLPSTLWGHLGDLVDLQRPENIIDLISARRVLEVEAAGRAALRITAMINGLAGQTLRVRMWRAVHEEGVERLTHAEHQAILSAMIAREPDAARLRMGVHLLSVEQYLRSHLHAGLDRATG